MISLHAQDFPVLVCKDASLASQSEKASTLIQEILKRFTATGVMPNVHSLEEALDPSGFPENFTDGMNEFCNRRNGYDDENIALSDGLKRDFVAVTESSDPAKADQGTESPADEVGGNKDGE